MAAEIASLTLRNWHGRRMLALLCAVAFLDFVDASITNVALPHIRTSLGFSVQGLQWVPSAYLLTYGGFMRCLRARRSSRWPLSPAVSPATKAFSSLLASCKVSARR
jgi:MFS family permease